MISKPDYDECLLGQNNPIYKKKLQIQKETALNGLVQDISCDV